MIKEDKKAIRLGEEDVLDRVGWRRTIHGGTPEKGKRRKERRRDIFLGIS